MKIHVIGTPVPQGSKRHVGHGVMVESSKKVAPWRQDVVAAVLEQVPADQRGMDGPLELMAHFKLPGLTKPSKKRLAQGSIGRPDLSKLVRSTEDALVTSGLIKDDARIVWLVASKRFAIDGEATGAFLEIRNFNQEKLPA